MGFVKIFVVKLDKFYALILFQSRKFFKLLSEQIGSELYLCILIVIIKVFNVFNISLLIWIEGLFVNTTTG